MTKILLIISGSIGAYKGLELIRLLRMESIDVKVVLTAGGAHFITPLSCSVLSENPVFTDLFSLTEEREMGHIRLARETDMVVIAPATADLIAKAAQGRADDLASTILLATTAPLMMVPAMNVEMWKHPATQANLSLLTQRGVSFIGPDEGKLACGEIGLGKMIEPTLICTAIMEKLKSEGSLRGKKALVTAGPTREPIDPIRYLSNGSSGKQGYAIAETLLKKGAEVILITGPSALPLPKGAQVVSVQTAEEMWNATESSLPVDLAICTAAVSDWCVETIASQKMKKGFSPFSLSLIPTRDILNSLATHKMRPKLLIGFAAETENVIENAKSKLSKCDWILANDVSQGIFGSDDAQVHFLTPNRYETWPRCGKKEVANMLITHCERALT